jgi:hypothetical protein
MRHARRRVCTAPAGGTTTYLLDHFTDANGTQLTSHTMDTGPGWTQYEGTAANCTIISNQADLPDNPDTLASDAGGGHSDVTESVKAIVQGGNVGNGDQFGLVGRLTDANNYWLLMLDGNGNWVIYEKSGGSFTSRASTTLTVSSGTFTLQGVYSGATITATVNGAHSINYSSATSNQTATKFGLRSVNSSGAHEKFDDFQVTS